jgi:hypothetical protein
VTSGQLLRIGGRPDLNRGWRFCRQGRDVYVVDSSCFLVGPTPRFPWCLGVIVPKLFPGLETRRARNRTAHGQMQVAIASMRRAFADATSNC